LLQDITPLSQSKVSFLYHSIALRMISYVPVVLWIARRIPQARLE